MIVVAVRHCSRDPGSKEPLSAALASEKKNVTGVDMLQEVLLAYTVELPEYVLLSQQVVVDWHLVLPERVVQGVPGHSVLIDKLQFNELLKLVIAFNHVFVVLEFDDQAKLDLDLVTNVAFENRLLRLLMVR